MVVFSRHEFKILFQVENVWMFQTTKFERLVVTNGEPEETFCWKSIFLHLNLKWHVVLVLLTINPSLKFKCLLLQNQLETFNCSLVNQSTQWAVSFLSKITNSKLISLITNQHNFHKMEKSIWNWISSKFTSNSTPRNYRSDPIYPNSPPFFFLNLTSVCLIHHLTT